LSGEHGDGVVEVKEVKGEDGLPDLRVTVDRSRILTTGKKAVGDFLTKLQVYRSMGDVENGRKMFEHYSEVPEDGNYPFAKWHAIVTNRRRPRAVLIMPNTKPEGEDSAKLITYPKGAEGKIQSWTERFSTEEFEHLQKILPNYIDSRTELLN